MLTYFRPRIKDQGAHIVPLSTGSIPSITANTTNTFGVGGYSDKDDTRDLGHTAYIDEVIVGCVTAPADADGTVLLNVQKYDASAAAAVAIVTGFDMEALVAGKAERATLDTLTDSQRILDFGDYLYIELVNNSAAINTQMVGGTVVVSIKLLT